MMVGRGECKITGRSSKVVWNPEFISEIFRSRLRTYLSRKSKKFPRREFKQIIFFGILNCICSRRSTLEHFTLYNFWGIPKSIILYKISGKLWDSNFEKIAEQVCKNMRQWLLKNGGTIILKKSWHNNFENILGQ